MPFQSVPYTLEGSSNSTSSGNSTTGQQSVGGGSSIGSTTGTSQYLIPGALPAYNYLSGGLGDAYRGFNDQLGAGQQQLMQSVLGGYQGMYDMGMGLVDTYGTQQRRQLEEQYTQERARQAANRMNLGLTNTTIAGSQDTGLAYRKQDSEQDLNQRINEYKLNTMFNLGNTGLQAQIGLGQNALAQQGQVGLAGLGLQGALGQQYLGLVGQQGVNTQNQASNQQSQNWQNQLGQTVQNQSGSQNFSQMGTQPMAYSDPVAGGQAPVINFNPTIQGGQGGYGGAAQASGAGGSYGMSGGTGSPGESYGFQPTMGNGTVNLQSGNGNPATGSYSAGGGGIGLQSGGGGILAPGLMNNSGGGATAQTRPAGTITRPTTIANSYRPSGVATLVGGAPGFATGTGGVMVDANGNILTSSGWNQDQAIGAGAGAGNSPYYPPPTGPWGDTARNFPPGGGRPPIVIQPGENHNGGRDDTTNAQDEPAYIRQPDGSLRPNPNHRQGMPSNTIRELPSVRWDGFSSPTPDQFGTTAAYNAAMRQYLTRHGTGIGLGR